MIQTYKDFNANGHFTLKKSQLEDGSVYGVTRYIRPKLDLLFVPRNTVSIVLHGRKSMGTDCGRFFTMQQNSLLFVPAGSYIFSDISGTPQPFSSVNIELTQERSYQFNSKLVLDNWFLQDRQLRGILPNTMQFLTDLHHDEHLQESYAPNIEFAWEIKSKFPIRSNITGDELVFKETIHRHLVTCRSLPEFAEKCNMSLATFKRHFQYLYCSPAKSWIVNKRLEIAKFLLLTSNQPVYQSAFEAGFEDLSYFVQLFKKRFKTTPKKMSQKQHF